MCNLEETRVWLVLFADYDSESTDSWSDHLWMRLCLGKTSCPVKKAAESKKKSQVWERTFTNCIDNELIYGLYKEHKLIKTT